MPRHAYPLDLAAFVRDRWPHEARPLPPPRDFDALLSVAYQATLLRDEERPVTFRLIMGEPAEFEASKGPPLGLHRLVFERPRPLTEHELRRLSQAAHYARSLLGVRVAEEGLEIWGMLQSGPRWLRAEQGGRRDPPALPPMLVVRGTGPGRVAVDFGGSTLGELSGGEITDLAMDVFESRWLPGRFVSVRAELDRIHAEAQAERPGRLADVDQDLTSILSQQMFKRIVATIRSAKHGGTVLVLPPECGEGVSLEPYLRMKYEFVAEEPRRRYRTLITRVMRALAEARGGGGRVGWRSYVSSDLPEVSQLSEAIFEFSHLVAGLSEVDGAVVMTRRFELVGFGGEITGNLPEVTTVMRALDLEARARQAEGVENVGTRHRSVYRFCQRFRDALGVVISQDDTVRFVTWMDDAVTYWDHVAHNAGEV